MKTFRRDKLRRLCEKGKLELAGSYHFDDMYGASRTSDPMPVAMIPENRADCREGTCYLYASDFETSGRAWENENGTVTLIVHSNCNYSFRILP